MANFSGDIVKDKALKSRYELVDIFDMKYKNIKNIHISIQFSMALTHIGPVYNMSCRYNIRVKCMKNLELDWMSKSRQKRWK